MTTQIPLPKLEGYVIYDPTTGLFSSGGMPGKMHWRKKPKIWTGIGPLKNHLRQFKWHDYDRDINGYSIDEFILKVSECYKHAVIIDISTGKEHDLKPYDFLTHVVNTENRFKRRVVLVP